MPFTHSNTICAVFKTVGFCSLMALLLGLMSSTIWAPSIVFAVSAFLAFRCKNPPEYPWAWLLFSGCFAFSVWWTLSSLPQDVFVSEVSDLGIFVMRFFHNIIMVIFAISVVILLSGGVASCVVALNTLYRHVFKTYSAP